MRIAVVDADQDFVGRLFIDRENLRVDFFKGRQVSGLARGDIRRVHVPVFVAFGILVVQDVLPVIGPVVIADAAFLVSGDRFS